MVKLTIDNNHFVVDKINYYTNGLSPLSSFTIFGLKNIETAFLNKTVSIWINDSIFLKLFTIVSIHASEADNNIILFGKEENYDR